MDSNTFVRLCQHGHVRTCPFDLIFQSDESRCRQFFAAAPFPDAGRGAELRMALISIGLVGTHFIYSGL